MKCKNCNTINEEDAVFCKKCGESLVDKKKKNNKKENVKPKTKVKTKTKTKTKVVKKVVKEEKKDNKKEVEVKKKNTGNKILVFLLLVLLGVGCYFGYDYYESNYNISVPNLVGKDYSEAEKILSDKNLKITKEEKLSEDENVNKVIKQDKKASSKVKKNTIINVVVGVKDTRYKVDKFIGKNIDEVTSILDEAGIRYEIQYNEDFCTDGEVLKQDPFSGERLDDGETLFLLVCKKIEGEYTEEVNPTDSEEEEVEVE